MDRLVSSSGREIEKSRFEKSKIIHIDYIGETFGTFNSVREISGVQAIRLRVNDLRLGVSTVLLINENMGLNSRKGILFGKISRFRGKNRNTTCAGLKKCKEIFEYNYTNNYFKTHTQDTNTGYSMQRRILNNLQNVNEPQNLSLKHVNINISCILY